MLEHTDHSRLRSAQRGLSEAEIEYVLEYGSRFHRAGALIYFLRERDLPLEDRRKDWTARLVGTALVADRDGCTLLTTWRNRRKGLKVIRKKPVYRFHSSRTLDWVV